MEKLQRGGGVEIRVRVWRAELEGEGDGRFHTWAAAWLYICPAISPCPQETNTLHLSIPSSQVVVVST